jgi:L-fuconolactonase
VVDAHVHFWDPAKFQYDWLSDIPALQHPHLPADYTAESAGLGVAQMVFVECNCLPSENVREAMWVEQLDERVAGIVAFADLTDTVGLGQTLDQLQRLSRVRGIRHNIQGQAQGFCLQPAFVDGVREVGRRGLTFDVCVTHDQLDDVVQLVRRCPDTRLVLDHCGKPAIRSVVREPWQTRIAELAGHENVWCKISGLLTEADPNYWREEELLPYAQHVVSCFGTERVLYGSDWPVLKLAGRYVDWLGFTRTFTASWSAAERQLFYHVNATHFYGLNDSR